MGTKRRGKYFGVVKDILVFGEERMYVRMDIK
jgi:hypothetical protein